MISDFIVRTFDFPVPVAPITTTIGLSGRCDNIFKALLTIEDMAQLSAFQDSTFEASFRADSTNLSED